MGVVWSSCLPTNPRLGLESRAQNQSERTWNWMFEIKAELCNKVQLVSFVGASLPGDITKQTLPRLCDRDWQCTTRMRMCNMPALAIRIRTGGTNCPGARKCHGDETKWRRRYNGCALGTQSSVAFGGSLASTSTDPLHFLTQSDSWTRIREVFAFFTVERSSCRRGLCSRLWSICLSGA